MIKKTTYLSAMMIILAACNKDAAPDTSHEIVLTTPVIELGEVEAVATRAAAEGTVTGGTLTLYVQNAERQEMNNGTFELGTEGWAVSKQVAVTGGAANYYAGLVAEVDIEACGTIPAITDAVYAYRGIVNVHEDGTFVPVGKLDVMSAALEVNLIDAQGAAIDVTDGKYIVEPVGLRKMAGFSNGYPNTTADPELAVSQYPVIGASVVNGNYAPVTYSSDVEGTTSWQIFTITYCEFGFLNNEPKGPYFTWNVNYDGELQLEAGMLYTFTVNLPDSQVITKGSAAESSAHIASAQVVDFSSVR